MTANDNNSYLPYLNKLADQHNNAYQHSICKEIINDDCWLFSFDWKKLRQILKLQVLTLMIELELITTIFFLVKAAPKIGPEKYLLVILFRKLILALLKLKKI